MFAVLAVCAMVVLCGAWLSFRSQRAKKKGLFWTGIVVSSLAVCVTLLRLAAWLMFGIGPIYSSDSWPHSFKDMIEVAQADTAEARITGLGEFIDSAYVWRLTVSPEQVDRIVAEYQLEEVAPENVPGTFWSVFPFLWRPEHSVGSRYYATSGFPAEGRGPDGEYWFAMYDSKNEVLYVWYKFNF